MAGKSWSPPAGLLTEKQAALRLGFRSVHVLQRMRFEGTGPAYVEVAGRVSYRPESIAQFIIDSERTSPRQKRRHG